LTIPREVVIGIRMHVVRWGAIDMGPGSGDIQHFDDNGIDFPPNKGLTKHLFDAWDEAVKKAIAAKKAQIEKEAAEKALKAKEATTGGTTANTKSQ